MLKNLFLYFSTIIVVISFKIDYYDKVEIHKLETISEKVCIKTLATVSNSNIAVEIKCEALIEMIEAELPIFQYLERILYDRGSTQCELYYSISKLIKLMEERRNYDKEELGVKREKLEFTYKRIMDTRHELHKRLYLQYKDIYYELLEENALV
uniref:Uncharacterized protein n=1 Tax=Clastoptera arizonana TaxID=38151 RepID=A0A1B6DA41_9HEMI